MHALDALDHTASVIVTAFVNGLWQGLVLLGLIWCLLRVLEARRRLNATTRYAVWSLTLVALVGLPVGAGLIVAMQPGSPMLPVPVESASLQPEVAPAPALEELPRAVFATPELPVFDEAAVGLSAEPLIALVEPLQETVAIEPVLRPSRWHLMLPPSMGRWMSFLFGAWLLVALVLVARVAWGYVYLRWLKRQGTPLPSPYQQRLDAWRRAYGLRRPVRIAGSETLAAPVAAGLSNPMILVPVALLDHLTEEEFDQVALHEWAHLQRWDDWTNLLQRLAEAIFFFHPGVLWIGRQMDREREMACDDWVVARTRRPRSYATCLTRLVELNVHARALLVAPGMATSKERLFERVKRLLDQRRPITAQLSKTGLLTMALALVAALLLIARLAPIFTPPESSEEVSEPVLVPEISEPESLALLVEPEALAIVEPTLDSFAELQKAVPQLVPVKGEGLIKWLHSTSTFQSLRLDSMMFQPLRLDTILAFRPLRLGLGFRALQLSNYRLQSSALTLLRTQQTLQVSNLRLQQSAVTLNRIQPMLQQSAVTLNRIEPTLRQIGAQRQDLSIASWIRVLKSAARISSSGDKARFLVEAARRLPDNEEVYAAYLVTTQTVGSSGDQTRALSALLAHHRLGRPSLLLFLDAVKGVASGGDKTRLLIKVAAMLPDDEDVRAAYVDVAESIASPGNYRRAMKALK